MKTSKMNRMQESMVFGLNHQNVERMLYLKSDENMERNIKGQ